MELADMRDLGSRAERRAGSTPVTRTTSEEANCTPLPPGRRKLRIRWLLLPFRNGSFTGDSRFGYGERFGFGLPRCTRSSPQLDTSCGDDFFVICWKG